MIRKAKGKMSHVYGVATDSFVWNLYYLDNLENVEWTHLLYNMKMLINGELSIIRPSR